MKMRIITSVAVAAGLALSLSACAKKDESVAATPTTDQPATAGPARTDGAPEQQK